MKFSLSPPGLILYPAVLDPWTPAITGADIIHFARAADRTRFDWLSVPDHIVMPREMSAVMGSRYPESITASAVLAGATERIQLKTNVTVVPLRHPLLLAKQIATLDFLTGGRFALGVGVGHIAREFELLGVDFENRGQLTDDSLQALICLWTEEQPEFLSETVSFGDLAFEPKPARRPYPPLFIGGQSGPALRRAARFGDGWVPWLVTVEELPRHLDGLRRQPGFEEKEDRFEIFMPLAPLSVCDDSHRVSGERVRMCDKNEACRSIDALTAAGATTVSCEPGPTDSFAELLEWVQWFDEEVIAEYRDSAGP